MTPRRGTLVLLRHAQSLWNVENRFSGWADVALSPRGIEEARLAGEQLRRQGKFSSHSECPYTMVSYFIYDLWYDHMTRTLSTIVMGFAILALTGCGGGSSPQTFSTTTSILSDSAFDGDIEQTSQNSFTVTQGMSPTVQSVFAGVDPVGLTEYRAFLDFPLGGARSITYTAVIDSAYLEIHINSIQPNPGTIPILIELVSFQPPTLLATDFDRNLQPPLAYTRILPPISSVDVGSNISIDVTSLMVEAQYRGLSNFQVRILEDFGTSPGLIEINDTTGINRPLLAPLLTVTYY